MSQALIISGFHFLEFEELRINSLRLPEVLKRIRFLQKLWDRFGLREFDLLNTFISEDVVFNSNQKIKSLLVQTVQMGFYDRFSLNLRSPDHIIFDKQSSSVVDSILGELSFESHITDLLFDIKINEDSFLRKSESSLSNWTQFFSVEPIGEEKIKIKTTESQDLNSSISLFVEKFQISEFIFIGPSLLKTQLNLIFSQANLNFLDTIDLDPMLDWFWGQMKPVEEIEVVC